MKNCVKCNELKSIEDFYKSKRNKDGLYTYCKVCQKLKRNNSYKKNKEIETKRNKIWYENNKEKIKEYRKEYYIIIKENNINNKKQRWFDKYLQNKTEIDKYFNKIEITKDNVEQYVRKYNRYKTNLKSREYTKNWSKVNLDYRKIYYNENKEKMIKQIATNNKKRLKTDAVYKFKCNVRSLVKGSFKRGTNQFRKDAKTEFILGCTIEEFRLYIEKRFTDGMTFENHGLKGWHLDHIIPLSTANTEEEIIKLNHYTNFQPLWAEDNLKKGNKIII